MIQESSNGILQYMEKKSKSKYLVDEVGDRFIFIFMYIIICIFNFISIT